MMVNAAGLEHAKSLVAGYKQGKIAEMNDELWKAKKVVDSTLHPGMCCTGCCMEAWANVSRYR